MENSLINNRHVSVYKKSPLLNCFFTAGNNIQKKDFDMNGSESYYYNEINAINDELHEKIGR